MQKLLEVMRRLRAPEGCPWDREQTHQSLRPYLLEEAAEAVDALAEGEPQEICEELGDVLLQVAFHAVIAEEEGTFGYPDVERTVVEKLMRRHPHVFGEVRVADAGEVVRNWQQIKASEKPQAERGADAVPRSLPALMRAEELGEKLGWPAADAEAVRERLEAAAREPGARAVGELLLAVVDLARAQGVRAELALRDATEARLGQRAGSV